MDDFQKLRMQIREAIRLGKNTRTEIAGHCETTIEAVHHALNRMITDGEIAKTQKGALIVFEFVVKSGKPSDTSKIKEKILTALRDGYRTLPWIKKYNGWPVGFDIGDELDELQFDRVIEKCVSPEISAYFECGRKPKDFWLTTDGKVDAVYEEPEAVAPSEEIKEVKKKTAEKTRKTPGKIAWSEDLLQKLAAEHGSMNKSAQSLGVDLTSLRYQLVTKPQFAAAWARGQEVFKAKKSTAKPKKEKQPKMTATPKKQPVKTDYAALPVTPEEDEAMRAVKPQVDLRPEPDDFFDHNGKSEDVPGDWKIVPKSTAAEAVPTPARNKGGHPDTPGFVGCTGCGNAFRSFPKHIGRDGALCDECAAKPGPTVEPAAVEVDPRFENTFRHLQRDERSREGFERVQAQLVEQAKVSEPPPSNFGYAGDAMRPGAIQLVPNIGVVELAGGGKIVAGFEGNFFKMDGRTRELLNKITDLMQEFEEGK